MFWCVSCRPDQKSADGFTVDLARAPKSCRDGPCVVAIAVGMHKARLNAEPETDIAELGSKSRRIHSTRAETLSFVMADSNTSWGDFLELVDQVWPESEVVSLITPQVDVLARRRLCLDPTCGNCEKLVRIHGNCPPSSTPATPARLLHARSSACNPAPGTYASTSND